MTTPKLLTLLALLAFTTACQKHRENPPATANTAPPPSDPPPTDPSPCQGFTTTFSLPAGTLINDNSQKDFTIPGFDVGCGDSVRVYMRRPEMVPPDVWTEYFAVDNGASHYSLHNGNVVTMYNKTGIILEIAVEGILQ